MMDSRKALKETILCRTDQIEMLHDLLGNTRVLPGTIFLHGHGGTGKTLVISAVCENLDIKLCRANCLEVCSPRIIYESLLNQMAGFSMNPKHDYASITSAISILEFVRNTMKIIRGSSSRFVILLEQTERLRDAHQKVFWALCRLQELCGLTNVCVILTSQISLDKFRDPSGFVEPLVLTFPQYTKDELATILVAKKRSVELSESSYKNYVSLILNVFYMATRNLPELQHLVELNYSFYVEPITKGDIKEDDVRSLWKNIENRLKHELTSVYLREISSDQFLEMEKESESEVQSLRVNASHISRLELPFYSKFLLAASYLASYNPASSDKRFFMSGRDGKRKTQSSVKAKLRANNQLFGAKTFSLDRMLAIFYSIIEDKVAPTAKIFSQVSSLVSLGLLHSVGHENIDCARYKCTVSLENIRYISRTVNFDIVKYLYEFAE